MSRLVAEFKADAYLLNGETEQAIEAYIAALPLKCEQATNYNSNSTWLRNFNIEHTNIDCLNLDQYYFAQHNLVETNVCTPGDDLGISGNLHLCKVEPLSSALTIDAA